MPMKLKSITSIRSDAVVARSSRVIPTIKKTSCVFGSCSGHGQNKDKPSNRYKCLVHNDTKTGQKD